MNKNNTNYITPFDAGEYDYLFDKILIKKIISLWLNGRKLTDIAAITSCTIDYASQVVDREIYYQEEVKK